MFVAADAVILGTWILSSRMPYGPKSQAFVFGQHHSYPRSLYDGDSPLSGILRPQAQETKNAPDAGAQRSRAPKSRRTPLHHASPENRRTNRLVPEPAWSIHDSIESSQADHGVGASTHDGPAITSNIPPPRGLVFLCKNWISGAYPFGGTINDRIGGL